jgi:hypothetical protein
MEPGSIVVMQMHYNGLTAGAEPDRSMLELSIAEQVEREVSLLLFTNYSWVRNGGMDIPPHEPDVVRAVTADLTGLAGLLTGERIPSGVPLLIYGGSHHQHLLGTRGRQAILRTDGTEECVVDIPRWDFAWQDAFGFVEPMEFRPGDRMYLECHWDNTEANQPLLGGERQRVEARDWGEGTGEEMCISAYIVSRR